MINDIRVSANFKLREFQCRCCGVVKLSPRLLAKLEELRAAWGGPLIITSGYRCEKHNAFVKGSATSFHLQGMAADIAASPRDQQQLREIAIRLGFTEKIMGAPENYIHVAYK